MHIKKYESNRKLTKQDDIVSLVAFHELQINEFCLILNPRDVDQHNELIDITNNIIEQFEIDYFLISPIEINKDSSQANKKNMLDYKRMLMDFQKLRLNESIEKIKSLNM